MNTQRYNFFQINNSFWKAWICIFISGLILVLTFRALSYRPHIKNTSVAPRIIDPEEIAEIIYTRWTGLQQNLLSDLADILTAKKSLHEKLLHNWLDTQNKVISSTVWYRNSDKPLRQVQTKFWEFLKSQPVSVLKRKRIIDYVLSNSLSRPSGATELYTSRALLDTTTGLSLVSLGIFLPDSPVIQSLEIYVKLDDLQELIFNLVKENEIIVIADPDFNLLVFTDHIKSTLVREMFEHNKFFHENRQIFSAELEGLPWRVIIAQSAPKDSAIMNPEETFIDTTLLIILFVLLVISWVAASITAPWINKPLLNFTLEAADIARGDFTETITASSNPELNKLVKIFNYMAKETNRFQQIDVHEIVTEKKKIETILRNIADGVVVTDSYGQVVIINTVIERWFDLSENEITGKKLDCCFPNADLPLLVNSVFAGDTINTTEFTVNIPGIRKPKIFHAHSARLVNEDGSCTGVVTIIRDITKEKEADKIKTELISMVAHELKSPLTSIYGFSELLLESDLPDEQARDYAKVILNESSRLTDLVNKFLDLSRLEAGKTEINMNPFNFKQLIEKVVMVHKGLADKRNIKVVTEFPRNVPLASGDPDFLEQVIVNLFSNAVKYSPSNSKIGIELKCKNNRLQINVIDNGYGIPKESLPHIFNKFYRVVEYDDENSIEGSGLGLALAREIVEQHGSTIKVNSKLGVGSVFSFSIPIAEIQ